MGQPKSKKKKKILLSILSSLILLLRTGTEGLGGLMDKFKKHDKSYFFDGPESVYYNIIGKTKQVNTKWLTIMFNRDHQQITFIMLNRVCLLIKKAHTPMFLKGNEVGWNTNQNQMKTYMPFLHYVGLFQKKIQTGELKMVLFCKNLLEILDLSLHP